jgi:hypothetical protein
MMTRVDVMVTGGDDVVVSMITTEQDADLAGDGGASRDGERPTFAEVPLDIDD